MHKDIAAFSYIWVMSFVVFFARKDSKFTQYHSKQAMVLTVASLVWLVPIIGHFLMLFVVCGMVLGFIHAAQGQYSDVPVAGPLSRGEFDFKKASTELFSIFQKIVAFIQTRVSHKKPPENAKNAVDNPSSSQVL